MMEIKGNDVVIPTPISTSAQKRLVLSYFRHLYPEGVYEEADHNEFMFYTDTSSRDNWDKHGHTDENASKMFHVICRDGELTIVHENAELCIEEIRKNLKANFCF